MQRIPFKVDHYGYTFCGGCLGFGRDGSGTIRGEACTLDELSDFERCDGCWKSPDAWPTITKRATFIGEFVRGPRIF